MTLDSLKKLYEQTLEHSISRTSGGVTECMFIHRTAVIMADGEVVTCANMYAEHVGYLEREASLANIWNNDRMQSVRTALGSPDEWSQCSHCWFRKFATASSARNGRQAAALPHRHRSPDPQSTKPFRGIFESSRRGSSSDGT